MLALFRRPSFMPISCVFLPFAAGYYLSYLFRTINALIASHLIRELGYDAAFLGLLTSVYFLSFAAAQLPLGVLLDRFGPRLVQAPLMLVAGGGALLFALGEHRLTLLVGRGLIGLGVAGALMSGLKAVAMWFPKERLSLFNGWFIMLGTAGSVMATEPSALILELTGWRGLFVVLFGCCLVISAAVFFVVPGAETLPRGGRTEPGPSPGLRQIYTDRRFLRLAPLSACCISTAWAVQGLWAARWLFDVEQYEETQVVGHLFAMACALSIGAGVIGALADRLRRGGVPLTRIFGAAATAFMVAQAMIVLRLPAPSYLLWSLVAAFGAMTVLSYAILGELFPKESAGRANAALNILHIGGAFLVQSAIGVVIGCWPADASGRYPEFAYQAGFALPLIFQIAATIWFVIAGRRASVHLVPVTPAEAA